MLYLKICDCKENHKTVLKSEKIKIRTSMGDIFIDPLKDDFLSSHVKFGFCRECSKAAVSKEVARKIVKSAVEEKQKELGILTGDDIRAIRTEMKMSYGKMGKFLQIPYSNIAHWEAGTLIQDRAIDQLIRIRTDEYLKKQLPSRKKLKSIFSHMIQQVDTSKMFLNKMAFYVDFWNLKRLGKSITESTYVPLQYGPCPDNYHEILKEMIDEGLVTPIEGHRFKVNIDPDMSDFTSDEMQTIDDVVKVAQTDKGKKLFDKSHKERGFKETPLYQPIHPDYAKDLKIEELLDEINEKS